MTSYSRISALGVAALLALSLPVRHASAQSMDPRWQAWLGCWLPNGSLSKLPSDTGGPPRTTMVCIVPGANSTAVQVVNFTDGRVISRGVVDASGQRIERTQDDCTGFETGRWSSDNRRVLIRSEFTCANNTKRVETGVLAMTTNLEWLQIQNLSVNGNSAVFVGRLRPAGIAVESIERGVLVERPTLDEEGKVIAPNRVGCTGSENVVPSDNGRRVTVTSDFMCNGLRRVANAVFERGANQQWVRVDKQLPPFTSVASRMAVSTGMSTDAIVEMVKYVDVATVEAFLTDRGEAFELSGRELVKLADNGVPPRVLDVLVALDNPRLLTLRRSATEPEMNVVASNKNTGVRNTGVYGGYSDPWGSPWDPYGFGYMYGYGSVYGYNAYNNGYRYGNNGFWGLGYPYSGRPIIVVPTGVIQQRARAVLGSGYTRDRGTSSGSSTTSTSSSSGASSGTSTRSASPPSSTSGSSGSSGGSSAPPARTAKARGGN